MNWLKYVLIAFGPSGSFLCIFCWAACAINLQNSDYKTSSCLSLNLSVNPWVESNSIYDNVWELNQITYQQRKRHHKHSQLHYLLHMLLHHELIGTSHATYILYMQISSIEGVKQQYQYTCLIWTYYKQQCDEEFWYTCNSHYSHMLLKNMYATLHTYVILHDLYSLHINFTLVFIQAKK